MSVLWVTSFNKEIYRASGKALIESFIATEIYGDLFIGYENDNFAQVGQNIYKYYNLHSSNFAKRWIKENQDLIPVDKGGTMIPCTCADPWAKQERLHRPGCYHTWFNRNTYRFVNKIFTLHEALKHYDRTTYSYYNYIIWIDADCLFKKQITSDIIEEVIFNDCKADLTILRGPRDFLEAGLVGYNINIIEGYDLLAGYICKYLNREFRKELIWDDCHVLEAVIAQERPIVHDLATTICGKHKDVFKASLIGEYISHDKGRHGRKLGLFK